MDPFAKKIQMLLNPAIFIQIAVSLTCTAMMILAGGFALQILLKWDINSGSQRQLRLERQTYLISTLVAFCFLAGIMGLLFFIQTCESVSPQFVGAMCATGVLNTNPYGWPLLFLKILLFFFGVVWLILNHLDQQGRDYPLIRVKYGLLLGLLPFTGLESLYLFLFFSRLEPNLIVSCCGSMFSVASQGVAAGLSGIAPRTALLGLIATGVCLIFSRLAVIRTRWGIVIYGIAALAAFAMALSALIALIGPYIYEHPFHHCPFCMLKSGYHFVGYLLYLPLFSGTAAALGALAVYLCKGPDSIRHLARPLVKRLVNVSVVMFALFYGMVVAVVFFSNLTMSFWYT